MEAKHRGSYDVNYSLDSHSGRELKSAAVIPLSRQSYHSTEEDTGGSTGSIGVIRHCDTQFDSSADETVIPYMIGETASQRYVSSTSIGAADNFDPESSPKSLHSRVTRRSIDTDQCGTLYEATIETDQDILYSGYNHTMAEADLVAADGGIEHCDESQHLVANPAPVAEIEKLDDLGKTKATRADYRVGSCYHCLINVPPGSLTAWILVFISIIGWATAAWLSLDYGKDLLKMVQTDDSLTYEEIALIAIALATVLITVVFLIIATFSSQKMSRYSFASSKKNTFGYCLSVTVIVLSFTCVLFWTCIVGLTMAPVAILALAHLLVKSDSVSCLHLQSYGVGVGRLLDQATSTAAQIGNIPITTSPSPLRNESTSSVLTSVGINTNITTVANDSTSTGEIWCGKNLDMWMEDAWRTLVPLLISLAFAVAIECCMLGFLIAASSNARHLKERMEYMNEPYTYSSENLNGNVKPVSHQDKTQTNNNQGDTQI